MKPGNGSMIGSKHYYIYKALKSVVFHCINYYCLFEYFYRKHQQPKSLDSQVQDALVQISSLSNRLQRERAVAAATASLNSNHSNIRENSPGLSNTASLNAGSTAALDNYLDYFDEPEPHNSSELDDIIAEEQQARFPAADPNISNDIKSECEDVVDDYEENRLKRHLSSRADLDDDEEDDYEDQLPTQEENELLRRNYNDVQTMRNIVLSSLHNAAQSSSNSNTPNRHHLRLQHLNRLQTRSYHEDLRAKRPRSQENISSSSNTIQNRSNSNYSNISFVRPTFSKPPVSSTINSDAVSTSSNSNSATNTAAVVNNNSNNSVANESELLTNPASASRLNRLELSTAALNPGSNSELAASTSPSNLPAAHVELCDCKTDPDAMFLMSLLPDIQKLNGRDRGKIKIAFQHILQDYLYPD